MNEHEKLAAAIVAIYAYYGKELNAVEARFWRQALTGFGVEEVEAAFMQHVQDPDAGRFCPRIADVMGALRGREEDQALVAWGEVLASARGASAGFFSDTTLRALESLGGLGVIRRAQESENGFLQRRFTDAWRAYRHRELHAALSLGANPLPKIERAT